MPNSYFNIELLLANISYLSGNNTLYEFGLNDSQFFFLESKEVHKESYPSLLLQEYNKAPFIIRQDNRFSSSETETVELPAFENIARANTAKTYKIKSGAYLSHFTTYFANNSINSFVETS